MVNVSAQNYLGLMTFANTLQRVAQTREGETIRW